MHTYSDVDIARAFLGLKLLKSEVEAAIDFKTNAGMTCELDKDRLLRIEAALAALRLLVTEASLARARRG